RVKAQACRQVEAVVCMMYPVDAPKQRDLVAGDMLQPDGEIENYEGDDTGNKGLNDDDAEQTPAFRFRPKRRPDGGCQEDDAQDQGGDHDNREIGDAAIRLEGADNFSTIKPRRLELVYRHRDKDRYKGAEAGDALSGNHTSRRLRALEARSM